MDFMIPEIQETASRFLNMMECDVVDGIPESCKVLNTNDDVGYIELSTFIDGSQASPELIYILIDHFSIGMPEDDFERLRWATREIQQKASRILFPEERLMEWGAFDGEKWVDRSLRVAFDPAFNQKMYDKNGNLRLKNVFVHANYQYIYNSTLDVLEFLRGNT